MPLTSSSPKRETLGAASFRRFIPFATASFLTVAAIIAGWEGASLWKTHNDGVDAWALESHHAAFEIADTLDETVRAIAEEMSIHDVPAAETMLAHHGAPEAALARFNDSMANLKQITFLAVFSESGDLLASTDPALKRQRVTVRGRDFLGYFANGGLGNHVTASYLTGPAIESAPIMRILVSSGLKGPDGGFGGVLVAAMAPNYLLRTQIDPALFLGKDVRLFLENGKLLAVYREESNAIGENFSAHPLFHETAALPRWGVLPNPFGDTPEIAALHKVDGLPFLVSVATTSGPQLHGWWHRIAFLLGYAGVSIAGVLIILLRSLWPHDDSKEAATTDASSID